MFGELCGRHRWVKEKNSVSMLNDVYCACMCLTVNSWYLSCSLRPVNAVHFKL